MSQFIKQLSEKYQENTKYLKDTDLANKITQINAIQFNYKKEFSSDNSLQYGFITKR
jgi:hypothetical protein